MLKPINIEPTKWTTPTEIRIAMKYLNPKRYSYSLANRKNTIDFAKNPHISANKF